MDENFGTDIAGVEMKVTSIKESCEIKKDKSGEIVEIKKFVTRIEPFRDELALSLLVKEVAPCSFAIGDIFVLKKIESQTKLSGKGKKEKKQEDTDTG